MYLDQSSMHFLYVSYETEKSILAKSVSNQRLFNGSFFPTKVCISSVVIPAEHTSFLFLYHGICDIFLLLISLINPYLLMKSDSHGLLAPVAPKEKERMIDLLVEKKAAYPLCSKTGKICFLTFVIIMLLI